MQYRFKVYPPKKVTASRVIAASEDDPRIDAVADLQDNVEEDFDYVMSGIERLVREGMIDEATNLLNTLSDTLNSAVGIIGNDFDKDKEI
jgi:hypothetical protein